MHVLPLRLNMHINQEPPLASTFPAALEGSRNVFISAVAMKRQSDPREDNLLVSSLAHHSNKKLAGREPKPSNQMRLKTYHDGVVYCGIFHSRDSRL
jgi:hypothetical protein